MRGDCSKISILAVVAVPAGELQVNSRCHLTFVSTSHRLVEKIIMGFYIDTSDMMREIALRSPYLPSSLSPPVNSIPRPPHFRVNGRERKKEGETDISSPTAEKIIAGFYVDTSDVTKDIALRSPYPPSDGRYHGPRQ